LKIKWSYHEKPVGLGDKPEDTKISKQVKLYCCNQLFSMKSHQRIETSRDTLSIRNKTKGPEAIKKRLKYSLCIFPRSLSLTCVK